MSGTFKIEVIFGRSIYALGIETARELLAGLERAAGLVPAAETLRGDLRREIARHDAGTGDTPEAAEAAAALAEIEHAETDAAPRCWFCDRPGRMLPYSDGCAARYVCGTPGCVRCGIPAERGEFENGCK